MELLSNYIIPTEDKCNFVIEVMLFLQRINLLNHLKHIFVPNIPKTFIF